LGLRKWGRKFAPEPKRNDIKACNERQGKYSHIVAFSRDEPVAIKLLLNELQIIQVTWR